MSSAKKVDQENIKKYKVEDLHRWSGNTRIEIGGKWWIVVANLQQEAWLCTPELDGYPFHTLKAGPLNTKILLISTVELSKARQGNK